MDIEVGCTVRAQGVIPHSSWCPFVLSYSSLSPHKFVFKSIFFSLCSGALTLLKLNYLYLLIIINDPCFIRYVIVNQVTDFYMSLILTVKGTSGSTTNFFGPSFQFRWKNQICFINF